MSARRMKTMQAVRPATDNHHLVEPGSERLDQSSEGLEVGSCRSHASFSFNSCERAFWAMILAWSLPRAGWWETSSHT